MTKYNELLKAILLPQFDRENFEKNYDDLMKMVLQIAKKRKYITLDIHGNIVLTYKGEKFLGLPPCKN